MNESARNGRPAAAPPAEKIRVLLVDDHPIIAEGLGFFLGLDPGLQVLGVAGDGHEGLKKLRQLKPEIVILDLAMPGMTGFEAIPLYREADPAARIVIFSANSDEASVYRALRSGAHGYVVKGSSPEELRQAIRYVRQDGIWISPCFSRDIVGHYLQQREADGSEVSAFSALSEREQQVFRHLVAGRETEEIGDLLCISGNTVAKHRTSLFQKLGVKNAVELVRLAIRHGLTEV